MFPTILLIIVVLIAAFIAYVSSKPGTFKVERRITINAKPEKIFPLINDFHKWTEWSPYEKMDTNMKKTYSGNESGVGAIYEWEGQKTGAGKMEMLNSSPSKITIKLDFSKPFEAHNMAEFILNSAGESTEVVWLMYGPSSFMYKCMSTFINMDEMVGKDFAVGLQNLKTISEK